MTSVMAATATANRKASSTVGCATSSASLENMKLMPKITADVSAASSERIWIFFSFMVSTSFCVTRLSYHTRAGKARDGFAASFADISAYFRRSVSTTPSSQ